AEVGLELTAVFGVAAPTPGQFEPLTRIQLRQIADHGDQVLSPPGIFVGQHAPRIWFQSEDRIAVLFVVIGDSFNGPADLILSIHGRILTGYGRPTQASKN
ncbi:MAG: hypothetical protein GWN55_03295, partial [Phycisphaerae bacterium]|nr:hypothetical protein [Phycisphaerae bacterium]NIV00350.1 hypothetical protein [Phycisphaerae bacterium]NIX30613.1 hypothetical protein [Phycisphaerae bacterium]